MISQSQLPGVDVVAVDLRVGQDVVGEVEQDHPEDKQSNEDGSLLWLTVGNLKIILIHRNKCGFQEHNSRWAFGAFNIKRQDKLSSALSVR